MAHWGTKETWKFCNFDPKASEPCSSIDTSNVAYCANLISTTLAVSKCQPLNGSESYLHKRDLNSTKVKRLRIFHITTDSQSPLLSFLEIRRFVKTCFVQQRHWLILFIYYSSIPWKLVYLITRHHFKWCVSNWSRPNLDKISKAAECLEKISVRGLWLLDIPSWSHDRLMKNWIIIRRSCIRVTCQLLCNFWNAREFQEALGCTSLKLASALKEVTTFAK